jgi:TonB family protein
MSLNKIILIILILGLSVFGQTSFEDGKLTLKYKQTALHSVLSELKNKTGANFIYSDDLIRDNIVTCIMVNASVENAIHKVLSSSNLDYKKFNGDSYVLFKKIKPTKKPYGTIIKQQTEINNIDSEIIITHPELISRSEPFYPSEALKNNLEGRVGIKLLINKDGEVIRTLVEKSSGHSVLDDAAVEYSGKLKFSPAIANKEPIKIWISMVFDYRTK